MPTKKHTTKHEVSHHSVRKEHGEDVVKPEVRLETVAETGNETVVANPVVPSTPVVIDTTASGNMPTANQPVVIEPLAPPLTVTNAPVEPIKLEPTVENLARIVDQAEAVKPVEGIVASTGPEVQPEIEGATKSTGGLVGLLLAFLAGLLLGFGAGFVVWGKAIVTKPATKQPKNTTQNSMQKSKPVETVKPTDTPATQSAVPELKRSDLAVKVLNGTGGKGVAGVTKEFLIGLGYVKVDTGNADASNFTDTVVSIKSSKKKYAQMLMQDLGKKYSVDEKTETLPESSMYDVVVTVGNK